MLQITAQGRKTMRSTITRLSIDYARKTLAHRKARAGMSCFYFLLTLLAAGALPASASTIGLCNTGFTVNCGALVSNLVTGTDGNYTLTSNPNGTGPTPFVVLTSPAAPDPLPSPWLPDTAISEWIGPTADEHFGGGCCPGGLYNYEILFSTTTPGETISGRWASDNGATMQLDIGTLVSSSSSFTSWTTFSFTVPSAGAHKLDFMVTNFSNATGLRVEFAPEPSTAALLGGGLALVLFSRRKYVGEFLARIRR